MKQFIGTSQETGRNLYKKVIRGRPKIRKLMKSNKFGMVMRKMMFQEL